jgi:dethiobiotin synthase
VSVFITGTDTDVGKTIVSAWVCMHASANYWKPIQTGDDSDKNVVRKFSPHTKIIPEAYKLKAPLSPYDSAKLENVKIDLESFNKCSKNNKDLAPTVIEGAGGVLVPIAENFLMADLIKMFGAKVLIVAKSRLGMINHLLMTVEVLKARKIDIVGIIMNGEVEDNLKRTIEEFSKLKILCVIPNSCDLIETLQQRPPAEILEILK